MPPVTPRGQLGLQVQGESSEGAGDVGPIVGGLGAECSGRIAKFDIGINDSANGVYLPRGWHQKVHTEQYLIRVDRALQRATSRDEALEVIRSIDRGSSQYVGKQSSNTVAMMSVFSFESDVTNHQLLQCDDTAISYLTDLAFDATPMAETWQPFRVWWDPNTEGVRAISQDSRSQSCRTRPSRPWKMSCYQMASSFNSSLMKAASTCTT